MTRGSRGALRSSQPAAFSAATFAVVGILFIAAPDGVLSVLDDVGDAFGSFAPAPETTEQLWLGARLRLHDGDRRDLLRGPADVVRYRPLLLVLAAGKAASSLATLGFYLFDDDVFAYLLNFLVDGFLVGVALCLWGVAGRVGAPAAPS